MLKQVKACPTCGSTNVVLYDHYDREWLCLDCQVVSEEQELVPCTNTADNPHYPVHDTQMQAEEKSHDKAQ